jgi:hypothetical protein
MRRVLRVLKRNGYPDWWYELQAKKTNHSVVPNGSTGKVAMVSAESHLSLIPLANSPDVGPVLDIGNLGSSLTTSLGNGDRNAWLLDSRASDHMTFELMISLRDRPPDAHVL